MLFGKAVEHPIALEQSVCGVPLDLFDVQKKQAWVVVLLCRLKQSNQAVSHTLKSRSDSQELVAVVIGKEVAPYEGTLYVPTVVVAHLTKEILKCLKRDFCIHSLPRRRCVARRAPTCHQKKQRYRQKDASRAASRITPQFSGGALPCEARRERIMKWRARAVAATTCHGPLQLLVMRHRDFPRTCGCSRTKWSLYTLLAEAEISIS